MRKFEKQMWLPTIDFRKIFLVLVIIGHLTIGFSQGIKVGDVTHIRANSLIGLTKQLINEHPELSLHFNYVFNVQDLKSIRKSLPENLAVINYMLLEKQLYIFCATNDSVFGKSIRVNGRFIREEVLKMYELVRYPGFIPSTFRGGKFINRNSIKNEERELNLISNNLYNILIGTIFKEISEKNILNIIPNTDLRILPFSALVSEFSDKSINYLCNDFTIINSNRCKLTHAFERLDFGKLQILAVGNPDSSLPYAEKEVKLIGNIFPSSRILLNDNATKDSILQILAGFNILHLASHGYFNYMNFDSSYILVAGDGKSESSKYLNLLKELSYRDEIAEYHLLVLSSCESGITFDEKTTKAYIYDNTFKQDNNYGTAGAFLSLGIGSVIATLWYIDDKSTSLFFENFYRNLELYSIPVSLNKAQIALQTTVEYRHPYYWAPFIYYGR